MEESKFQQKVLDELGQISNQLTAIETHSEYTKQGVKENKAVGEKNAADIAINTSDIKIINEWREALDKIIWEMLKPPLKFVGIGIFIVCMVGGWLLLK